MDRIVALRSYSGAGEANNFTSYDLLQLGVSRAELARPSESFALWVFNSGSRPGQAEYLQILVTAHTLPNRADTDGDGLNDSEEVTLGHDGYTTNPWMVDSDADGVADSLEVRGWAWSSGTIVPSSTGFRTDPTRADTDRDGVSDGQDSMPLGNAFLEVRIDSARVFGPSPDVFVRATVQDNTTWTQHLTPDANGWVTWTTTPPGTRNTVTGHYLTVDAPDNLASVDVTLEMWSYDANNVHPPVAISFAQEWVGGVEVCYDVFGPATVTFDLRSSQASDPPLHGCGDSTNLNAYPLNVHLSKTVPLRIGTTIFAQADYADIYNVTDGSGAVTAQRYVGEPRFVAFLLNVSYSWGGGSQDVVYVPRSVFYASKVYELLYGVNPVSPLDKLSLRQNATAAASNADDLQMIFTGEITLDEFLTLMDWLGTNSTGAVIGREIVLSVNDQLAGDSLFYSLPDGLVRLAGYLPPLTSYAWPYTFCTSGCVPPPPPPWWEQVWRGLVSFVLTVVVSAVVFAANAFVRLAEILSQVGSWIADQIVNAPARIASAVQAAAEVLGQVFDAVIQAIQAGIAFLFSPLIQAWNSYSQSISAAAVSILERHSPSCVELDPQACFAQLIDAIFAPGFYYLVLGLMIGLRVAGAWVSAVTFGMSGLAEKALSGLLGGLLGTLFGAAMGGGVALLASVLDYAFQVVPDNNPLWREGRSVGVLAILGGIFKWFAKEPNSRTVADTIGFILGIAGMALGFIGLGLQGIFKFAVAALGLGLSAFGFLLTVTGELHLMHFIDDNIPNPFEFVPSSVTLVATAISVSNFARAASGTML